MSTETETYQNAISEALGISHEIKALAKFLLYHGEDVKGSRESLPFDIDRGDLTAITGTLIDLAEKQRKLLDQP